MTLRTNRRTSKTEYGLTASSAFLKITACEFKEIENSMADVHRYLLIEAKFDLVVENFVEYESCLFEIGLRHLLNQESTWGSSFEDIGVLNRRLVNYLTAARLYIDQVQHDVGTLHRAPAGIKGWTKRKQSEAYDRELGYRAIERLRNVAQHGQLLIDVLTYGAAAEGVPKEVRNVVRYGVEPRIRVDRLNPKSVNKQVLDELKTLAESEPGTTDGSVSLTPLVRRHLEALGGFHEALRLRLSHDVEHAIAVIRDARSQVEELKPETLAGLRIISFDTRGDVAEEHSLHTAPSEHLKKLMAKNNGFDSLSQRYVHGAPELPAPRPKFRRSRPK